MAAGTLPAPGSKYGPCKGECAHTDCALTRKMSGDECRLCEQAIGYDTRFYVNDAKQPVHADCYEDQIELERAGRAL